MLQAIRDRAQGVIVWIIVGLIIVTFALFGLGSYLSGSSKSIVATVNGVEITQNEFIQEYQNAQQRLQQMLGENYDPSFFPEEVMKKRTLDSMIQRELLNQQLSDSGFNVSPQEVFKVIGTIPAFLDDDGKFSQEKYEQVLSYQRMSSDQFIARLGHDLATEQLQKGLTSTSLVTDAQVSNLQVLENQQRKIGYFILPIKNYLEKTNVTDEAIQEYYAQNANEFRTQERLSVEYVELKLQDIANQFDVSDEEVKKYYQQHQVNYTTQAEKRRVRHILIAIDKDTDDATAKTKAESLIERLNKGEDFVELAKTESSDTFSAKKGGDLGLNSKNDMDKVLAEVAFAMGKGSISAPIQSRFGYHILKVDEIEAAKVTPYDEAKLQIKKDLQAEKADDKFHTLVTKLDNLSYESADSLLSVADELDLEMKVSPMFTRVGGAGLFANSKVISAAFSDDVIKQNRNSELVELNDTHVVVVRKKDHQPASVKPLEQVKQLILSRLKTKQAREQSLTDAKAAKTAIEAGEKPDAVAAKYQQQWQDTDYISRAPEKGNTLNNHIREEAFRLSYPKEGSAVFTSVQIPNGDAVVLGVFEVKAGSVSDDKAKLAAEQQRLDNIFAQTEFNAFMAYLESKASISRNLKNTNDEN